MNDDRRYKSYQNNNPHKDRQNYNLTYEEETGKLYYWDAWGNRVELNSDTPVPPTPLEPATPDTLGGVKTDPDSSITVDEEGRLRVGGRLGQFAGGGLYYPTNITPEYMDVNTLLISEATNLRVEKSRTFALFGGTGITLKKVQQQEVRPMK